MTLQSQRCMQISDRHIHIPDIPVWVLVTGGAGAGGLIYYYRFFKKGHHAHAEPFTGPNARTHPRV